MGISTSRIAVIRNQNEVPSKTPPQFSTTMMRAADNVATFSCIVCNYRLDFSRIRNLFRIPVYVEERFLKFHEGDLTVGMTSSCRSSTRSGSFSIMYRLASDSENTPLSIMSQAPFLKLCNCPRK